MQVHEAVPNSIIIYLVQIFLRILRDCLRCHYLFIYLFQLDKLRKQFGEILDYLEKNLKIKQMKGLPNFFIENIAFDASVYAKVIAKTLNLMKNLMKLYYLLKTSNIYE